MKIKFFIALLLLGTLFSLQLFAQTAAKFEEERKKLVKEEIAGAGIKNERVLDAMLKTPRHEFVPLKDPQGRDIRKLAYVDMALPIGESQTISPPFIVAYMTEVLDPQTHRQSSGDRHRQWLPSGRFESVG